MGVVIRNLTPHTVVLKTTGGMQIRLPADPGGPARVASKVQVKDHLNLLGYKIPITSIEFGEVYNLPEEQAGTYLVCSRIVQQAVPERRDILVPDSLVRDSRGNIICCESLTVSG